MREQEAQLMRYIEDCTRRYGGVELRAILNYFPPDAEGGVIRRMLDGLVMRGWIKFDGRRYTA